MGDEGSRDKGVPTWQRTGISTPPPATTDTSTAPQTEASSKSTEPSSVAEGDAAPATQPPPPQADLLEQATRFLSDERMQTEPLHKKIEFLQSKGLSRATIDTALDLTSTKQDSPDTPQQTSVQATPSPSQPSNAIPRQEIAPIITYPEHLLQPQKPPPIITASRLLNTAYIASACGAAVYGLSRFLVKPMTDTLTHMRHDFAMHAHAQVDELNERLEGVVSTIPAAKGFSPALRSEDSDDEDPTELFHRDFGTQTETVPHRSSSGLSTPSSSDSNINVVELHTHKLHRLRELISSVASEANEETKSQDQTSAIIKMLNESLESMAYPSVANYTSDRYGIYQDHSKDKNGKDVSDEITKMKGEIRSVKGLLLSARHFPAGALGSAVSTGARGQMFS